MGKKRPETGKIIPKKACLLKSKRAGSTIKPKDSQSVLHLTKSMINFESLKKPSIPSVSFKSKTGQVRVINRADLIELKALPYPPALIKKVVDAVLLLLGHGKLDWQEMRQLLNAELLKKI